MLELFVVRLRVCSYGVVNVFLNHTGAPWFSFGNYLCLLLPTGNGTRLCIL
jgi:hypothetical protein